MKAYDLFRRVAGVRRSAGLVGDDALVIMREADPAIRSHPPELGGDVVVDEDRLARRLGEQLRVASALGRDEVPARLVHAVTDRQQAVALQDH